MQIENFEPREERKRMELREFKQKGGIWIADDILGIFYIRNWSIIIFYVTKLM